MRTDNPARQQKRTTEVVIAEDEEDENFKTLMTSDIF